MNKKEIPKWMCYTFYYIPDLCVYSLKSVSKWHFRPVVDKMAAPEKERNTSFLCHLTLWMWLLVSPVKNPKICSNLAHWNQMRLYADMSINITVRSNLFGRCVGVQILSLIHGGRWLETEAQQQRIQWDPQSL